MNTTESLISAAAHLNTLCISIIIVFHFLLIAGKPWGHLTMGGQFPGELPNRMKAFSGFSILILVLMMLVVEVAAGSFLVAYQSFARKAILAVIGYGVIGTILHIITPSKWERILWLPLIVIMLACSLVVKLF